MPRPSLALLLPWLALACGPRAAPGPAPASRGAVFGDAGPGAAVPAAGAPGPAAPRPLPLLRAEATLPDGGVPLARDGVAAVDPGSGFRVEVGAELPDARLSLLDGQDAIVPAAGTTEVGAVSRFTLVPAKALRAGSSYVLRLDGARTSEVHDARGAAYEPARWPLLTTGEKAAPPVRKKPRRRRG